ncbi:hypothetical protein LIER_37287 [Lithospermum erythrorhizon]|uniref:Uncharacterized protein n=1 Tax=Lithospermum erythrorhizon TaxID=34254 RepID=A0AAV3PIE4_LITER
MSSSLGKGSSSKHDSEILNMAKDVSESQLLKMKLTLELSQLQKLSSAIDQEKNLKALGGAINVRKEAAIRKLNEVWIRDGKEIEEAGITTNLEVLSRFKYYITSKQASLEKLYRRTSTK